MKRRPGPDTAPPVKRAETSPDLSMAPWIAAGAAPVQHLLPLRPGGCGPGSTHGCLPNDTGFVPQVRAGGNGSLHRGPCRLPPGARTEGGRRDARRGDTSAARAPIRVAGAPVRAAMGLSFRAARCWPGACLFSGPRNAPESRRLPRRAPSGLGLTQILSSRGQ